ncbi:MAG: hypothetical protein PWP23_2818 [Candidatus Sumerlaeota bacterium]|nr:hypothetical protein [Candidatus Sumerlaeota bacterium]
MEMMTDSAAPAETNDVVPSGRMPGWAIATGIGTLAMTLALLLAGVPGHWAAETAPANAVVLAESHPSGPTDEIVSLFVQASDQAVRDPAKHYEAAVALQAAGRDDEAGTHLQRAVEAYYTYWPRTSYPALFSDRQRGRIADAYRRCGEWFVRHNEAARGMTLLHYAQAIAGKPLETDDQLLGSVSSPTAIFRASRFDLPITPDKIPQTLAQLDEALAQGDAANASAAIHLARAQGWQQFLAADAISAPEGSSRNPDNFYLRGLNEQIVYRTETSSGVKPGELVLIASGTRSAGIGPLVEITTNHGARDLLYIHSLDYRPYPLEIELPAGTSEVTFTFLNSANETAFLTETERASADRRLIDRNVLFANLWIQREEKAP